MAMRERRLQIGEVSDRQTGIIDIRTFEPALRTGFSEHHVIPQRLSLQGIQEVAAVGGE